MDYASGELLVTGENATANIFATYPAKHLSRLNGFFDQVREDIIWFGYWKEFIALQSIMSPFWRCAFEYSVHHAHTAETGQMSVF